MCIYFKERNDLTYNSEDHIIPAGLGGDRVLPKGHVSDQFNNATSFIEQEFLRNSFVAVARAIEGPGKRGSLGKRHQSKSKINIFENESELHPFLLGYMTKGVTHIIPHFLYNSNFNKLVSLAPINEEPTVRDFVNKCQNANQLRIKTVYDERIREDLILFGIQSDVEEHYDGFIFQNKINTNSLKIDEIEQIATSFNFEKSTQTVKSHYRPSLAVQFSENHFRVFAKMAFNCLSYIKESEFVRASRFDKIREWIVNGGNNEFVSLNVSNYNPFTLLGVSILNSEHFIWIWTIGTDLIAYINLYGRPCTIIKLCENNAEHMQAEGLVCDWREHKEYSISEYVQKYTTTENNNQ